MIKVDCNYRIKDDIEFVLESDKMTISDLSEKTKISRTTIDEILKKGRTTEGVCEKFYSFLYDSKYRINSCSI